MSEYRCRLCGEELENRNYATDHLTDEHDLFAIVGDAALEEVE